MQRNRAVDPRSSVVSFNLENSTLKKKILQQLSLSSGPTAYSTSVGCSNLKGQPQIKHSMSGQTGLGSFLRLFCQLFKNHRIIFPGKITSGIRVKAAVTVQLSLLQNTTQKASVLQLLNYAVVLTGVIS